VLCGNIAVGLTRSGYDVTVGYAYGPKSGASLGVGLSLGSEPGNSWGVSCDVATPRGGGYVDVGQSTDTGNTYGGAGLSFGAELGCAAEFSRTQHFDWPSNIPTFTW
jgi:hypothetical protein